MSLIFIDTLRIRWVQQDNSKGRDLPPSLASLPSVGPPVQLLQTDRLGEK